MALRLALAAMLPRAASGEGNRTRMSKRAQRALEQLHMAPSPAARRGLARRAHGLPRPVHLELLHALLEQDEWELALMVYRSGQEGAWYRDNLPLQARLVAVLTKMERVEEAEALCLELSAGQSAGYRVRLKCALIESYARCGLRERLVGVYEEMRDAGTAAVMSQRALLRAYSVLELPFDAEKVLVGMKAAGIRPSSDDYKVVLEAFGKSALLGEMEVVFMEMRSLGLEVDRAAYNMNIAAYSQAKQYDQMVHIMHMMAASGVSPSVRTWNAVIKACPVLNLMASSLHCEGKMKVMFSDGVLERIRALSRGGEFDDDNVPPTPAAVLKQLSQCPENLVLVLQSLYAEDGELRVVRELLALGLLPDAVVQPSRIDLHGMELGTALVTFLLWLQRLHGLLQDNEADAISSGVMEVVTGWGRHSEVQGKSLVKGMVIGILGCIQSPFTVERQNEGALLAKKRDVERWLRSFWSPSQTMSLCNYNLIRPCSYERSRRPTGINSEEPNSTTRKDYQLV